MKKKIKVLHFITRFIRGGADENTMYTVLGLDKNIYDVTLTFGENYNKEMVNIVKASKVKIKIFTIKHFNIFSSIYSLLLVYNFIRKQRFDIVHTHSTEAGIIGRIAARIARTPIIIHTIHGVAFTPYRSKLLNYFILSCERFVDKYTNHFISNSYLITKEYLSNGIGKKEKFTTIYSGIDVERFNIKKSKNKIPVITIIARLAKGKGHEYFINAATTILKTRKAEFWIVGNGELKEEIENMITNLKLESYVKIIGERDDIPQILSQTDIFVLPTLWEGTPRTIFEAMAAGVPVITTPVGGIPEIIKDNQNGFLVEPKNSEKLAEKILFVLYNKDKIRLIIDDAKKESKKYSYKKMVNNIDQLYQVLLKNKSKNK